MIDTVGGPCIKLAMRFITINYEWSGIKNIKNVRYCSQHKVSKGTIIPLTACIYKVWTMVTISGIANALTLFCSENKQYR